MKYHQARRNTKNYQVDLETLQYDVLYGKRYAYGGENPFARTKMKMGLYDVTLDSIRLVSDSDWTYYIQGTNFTPSSQMKLNGEWYDTAYVESDDAGDFGNRAVGFLTGWRWCRGATVRLGRLLARALTGRFMHFMTVSGRWLPGRGCPVPSCLLWGRCAEPEKSKTAEFC